MFMHVRAVRRVAHVAALLGVGLVTAQCGSDSTLDPDGSPGHARLSIQPLFARAPGAPTVTLSRIHASLVAPNGDSSVTESRFQDGSATLSFDIPLFGGPTEFLLTVSAFDAQDALAYKFSKRITIVPGRTNVVSQPTLDYVAPDAAVTRLVFSPSSLQLDAGGTSGFTVTGMSSGGQPITPLRLAFTSKDPTIAIVDASTGAVTAGLSQGSTFIIAHTVIGVIDSALVKVHAPVDRVILTPASVSVARGRTTALAAELRDAGNHLIDDRSAAFTSADPTIATVTQTGVVTGGAIGKTTITASAEGKTATADVTVTSALDHIELAPNVIQLASIGESVTLAVKLVPVAGASIEGLTPTFSSSNAAVATVDDNGVVKAVGGGTATITADVDGVRASATVTVKQIIVAVSVSPRVASVSSIGASQSFASLALDAQGNEVKDAPVRWSSSDPNVASVDAKGTAVALRAGTTTITATVNDRVDAATFIVAPVASRLVLFADRSQIGVGQTAILSAKFTDAGGTVIGLATATFATTTPNVASLSGNMLTGLSAGVAHVTARANALTASLDITVTGSGGGEESLTITPPTAEKLPSGTQQFSASGGSGTYDWSVNGTQGGNVMFGTITASGFYTAPLRVPSPSTFDICASDRSTPTRRGCAPVTISQIVGAGGDVIVFNDINIFDSGATANVQLFKNMINFPGIGARANATGFMIYRGNHSKCYIEGFCDPVSWESPLASAVRAAGYTIVDVNDEAARLTSPVPPTIKAIMLLNPEDAFTVTEINNLKRFAGEGGRIIFVGEHFGYYGTYIEPVENAFLSSMGAVLRNPGNQGTHPGDGVYACPGTASGTGIRQHQLSTNITSVEFACSSEVELGPNDQAIFTFVDQGAERVLVAVAKVDLTLLEEGFRAGALRTVNVHASQRVPAASRVPPAGPGVPGWKPKR